MDVVMYSIPDPQGWRLLYGQRIRPHMDAVVLGPCGRGLFFNLHVGNFASVSVSSLLETSSYKKHLYPCLEISHLVTHKPIVVCFGQKNSGRCKANISQKMAEEQEAIEKARR